MVISDTWRTLVSHEPLRKFILECCQIKRLIKLNRYAFKTHGRNIDAFTIICEFKKEKPTDSSKYYFYDLWQIHPLKEKEYFSTLIKHSIYNLEKNEWPFDQTRTMRYQIQQKICENTPWVPIPEGNDQIFEFLNKNTKEKVIEV